MAQLMVERESCPRRADRVKRNGAAGTVAQVSVLVRTEMCRICTIAATSRRTTRLGSSAAYVDLCIFCTNSAAHVHRVNPSLGGCMRRSVGLGLLMTLACPLVVAAQGVPAADSLAKAASAASAANTVAINFVWTLVAGFLVMFMQAGFAMVETGFTRAKNAAHTITMNFMVYGIAMLAYWAIGFALQAGGVGALGTLGGSGFFLTGVAYTAPVFAYFLFQMVFMDTAATIPTGALAERWKFAAFAVFSVFVSAVIYPIYANWTWGGGWLAMLGKNLGLGHGHVDFAGSSVVHMTGGVMAFVTAILLGPRRGKYGADGSVRAIPGHNIPMALVGTFILAFGWFGFNAGSTLAGS